MSEEKTKEEQFKDNPDRFVDAGKLVVALMRTEQGPALLLNPRSRSEAVNALGEIQIAIVRECMRIDATKPTIVPAKGGIINAARNRLFKK